MNGRCLSPVALLSPSREGAGAMVDVDTFLTLLYVMVDDFCKTSLPAVSHSGPPATLSRREVMTALADIRANSIIEVMLISTDDLPISYK